MPDVTPCLHPGQVRRWVSFDQHKFSIVGPVAAKALQWVDSVGRSRSGSPVFQSTCLSASQSFSTFMLSRVEASRCPAAVIGPQQG